MRFGIREAWAACVALTLLTTACTEPTGVFAAGQPGTGAVQTAYSPEYTFEVPVGWTRQILRPGTVEQFTYSYAGYRSFKFTLFKYPYPANGAEASLAELCTLQDQLHDKTGGRGTFEKKDYRIDGRLCCYGIYREMEAEVHALTTLVGSNMYAFVYAFESKPVLDDTKTRVMADMERLFNSWHWAAAATASPSPSPTPTPSSSPHFEFPDYFPVVEGWRWTYRVLLDGETVGTLDSTAQKVTDRTSTALSTVTFSKRWTVSKPIPGHPNSDETETFEKVGLGMVRRVDGTARLLIQISLPAVDATWDQDGHHFLVETLDETVPTHYGPVVGAMKVVETTPDGTKVSRWYTEDLGLVQEITETKTQKLSVVLEATEGP